MTKQFTTLQLFSLVDGRLSTTVDDLYSMLNHICDENLMTHQLPTAYEYFKTKCPNWYLDEKANLNSFKASFIKNNKRAPEFKDYEKYLENENRSIDVPQLKDEFDTSDFGYFMIENSALKMLGKGKK